MARRKAQERQPLPEPSSPLAPVSRPCDGPSFALDPKKTTSIVNGDDVVYIGKGVERIDITVNLRQRGDPE